jgi:dTDP-4-dehydrorhamnose reductase
MALPGWWRRPDRIYRPDLQGRSAAPAPAGPGVDMEDRATRPLVILGATGTLGNAFARACEVRGIPYHVMTRREVDLANPRSVERALTEHSPWAVVNAAGYVRVDDAERDVELCMQANAIGPGVLAAACSRHAVDLVCFSSDLVFDGSHERLQRPYVESDKVAPLSVYGRSKAEMEQRVLDVMPHALIVRTAAFFGPWDRSNFVSQTIAALVDHNPVRAAIDTVVSPTYVVDLANTVLDLLIDRESGIWHVTNRGSVSWQQFAQRVASITKLPADLIEGVPMRTLGHAAPRPRYAVLVSDRGAIMPPLDDALSRYLRDVVLEAPRVREERRRAILGARRFAAA